MRHGFGLRLFGQWIVMDKNRVRSSPLSTVAWRSEKLRKEFEIKQKTISMEDHREVSQLNRIQKVSAEGNNIINDPKQSDLLLKESGIQEYSK